MRFPVCGVRLGNGLRVAVCPDPAVPVVAVNLCYGVGSGDDPAGASGMAHLAEHVLAGGDPAAVREAGGTANASTGRDRTGFVSQAPAGALDLLLWTQAMRMAAGPALVTEQVLHRQRLVVGQEKRQGYAIGAQHGLRLLLPAGHPYRRPPVGSVRELATVSPAALAGFVDRWYGPGNAVLSIVGDVDVEAALLLVERRFGGIRAGAGPREPGRFVPAPPCGPVRARVPGAAAGDVVQLVFLLPGEADPALEETVRALDVLAGGENSRLGRALLGAGLAVHVGTQVSRLAEVSYAAVSVQLVAGAGVGAVEQIVGAQLDALVHDGVDDDEAALVAARAQRARLARLSTRAGRAAELSRLVWCGADPQEINSVPGPIAGSGAVAQWLGPRQRATVVFGGPA